MKNKTICQLKKKEDDENMSHEEIERYCNEVEKIFKYKSQSN